MANYTLTNAYSLDYWIQQAQTRLYDYYLKPVLSLTDDNCMCFGRVERNLVDNKWYIPEAFINGNYVGSDGTSTRGGLFFEDGKFIIFFDQIENKKTSKFQYCAKMDLLVFADMSIITPNGITTSTQRLTEILLNGLESWMTYNGYGFTVLQTTFDIDKILSRWTGEQKKLALNDNLSNSSGKRSFGALKLSLELNYDPGQNQKN